MKNMKAWLKLMRDQEKLALQRFDRRLERVTPAEDIPAHGSDPFPVSDTIMAAPNNTAFALLAMIPRDLPEEVKPEEEPRGQPSLPDGRIVRTVVQTELTLDETARQVAIQVGLSLRADYTFAQQAQGGLLISHALSTFSC